MSSASMVRDLVMLELHNEATSAMFTLSDLVWGTVCPLVNGDKSIQ